MLEKCRLAGIGVLYTSSLTVVSFRVQRVKSRTPISLARNCSTLQAGSYSLSYLWEDRFFYIHYRVVEFSRNFGTIPQHSRNGKGVSFPFSLFSFPCLWSWSCFVNPLKSALTRVNRGCPRGVMVKAIYSGIVVREFVLQSRYYVHFRENTLEKGINPLSSQLWVK